MSAVDKIVDFLWYTSRAYLTCRCVLFFPWGFNFTKKTKKRHEFGVPSTGNCDRHQNNGLSDEIQPIRPLAHLHLYNAVARQIYDGVSFWGNACGSAVSTPAFLPRSTCLCYYCCPPHIEVDGWARRCDGKELGVWFHPNTLLDKLIPEIALNLDKSGCLVYSQYA